jgi:predicted nucleic acid-binding protein
VNNRFQLDSWALLAFLYREEPAADRVEHLLREAAAGRVRLLLSVVNLGEVFYIFGRRHGETAADHAVAEIKNLPINVLQVDEDRVMAAARLKMRHSVSYANAFAAATAEEFGAILLTGDPELLALKSDLQIEQLERA